MQLLSLWISIFSDFASFTVAAIAIAAIILGQKNFRVQQSASLRPLLRPEPVEGNIPGDKEVDRLYAQEIYEADVVNVGLGPAFNVSVTLFPPAAAPGKTPDPRRNAQFRIPSIDVHGKQAVVLHSGVTNLLGDTRIRLKRTQTIWHWLTRPFKRTAGASKSSYTLFAPIERAPVQQPHLQMTMPFNARMVITYQDAESVKHGAVFDHAWIGGWQLVAYLPNIDRTLDELDEESAVTSYSRHLQLSARPESLLPKAD